MIDLDDDLGTTQAGKKPNTATSESANLGELCVVDCLSIIGSLGACNLCTFHGPISKALWAIVDHPISTQTTFEVLICVYRLTL
jgi:hypothetical protein